MVGFRPHHHTDTFRALRPLGLAVRSAGPRVLALGMESSRCASDLRQLFLDAIPDISHRSMKSGYIDHPASLIGDIGQILSRLEGGQEFTRIANVAHEIGGVYLQVESIGAEEIYPGIYQWYTKFDKLRQIHL